MPTDILWLRILYNIYNAVDSNTIKLYDTIEYVFHVLDTFEHFFHMFHHVSSYFTTEVSQVT